MCSQASALVALCQVMSTGVECEQRLVQMVGRLVSRAPPRSVERMLEMEGSAEKREAEQFLHFLLQEMVVLAAYVVPSVLVEGMQKVWEPVEECRAWVDGEIQWSLHLWGMFPAMVALRLH